MKQYEAVSRVMEDNGGFATLGFLYQEALKVAGSEWKTKTPFASIRRIVQDERFFFKIRPGLWALKAWRDRLPSEMRSATKSGAKQEEFTHSYYQGLVVEIGNLKRFDTFIPAQDKNKTFLGSQKLGTLVSLSAMPSFTYPEIVRRTQSIDVIWFNERRMPCSVFEVEHSTNIRNSLVKFGELEDFRVEMFVVADKVRKRQVQQTLQFNAFRGIRDNVRFLSYEDVSKYHANASRLAAVESGL
ncbi:MAG: hypothetical protein JW720_03290 [Sedimentisphaerales bacterium]|nr:hypothetical protein [Sedimentisphaerales bacterium]